MKKLFIAIFAFVFLTCKDPYVAPVSAPDVGYLVVEGVVNSGAGNTKIRLSRTTPLTDGTRAIETGASVMIQNESGGNRFLAETAHGDYEVNDLNLDPTAKYRLRVVTHNKEYVSDFVPVNNNPAIDSVSWSYSGDGASVNVNTHDDQNIAKYFMWDFVETWEIHSDYTPNCKFNSPSDPYWVVYVDPIKYWTIDSSKYQCWRSDTSTQILLGSTIKYAVDTISSTLSVIPTGSEKISYLYSMNVRQYTLTKDAFEFMQKMKKNSEQLGSVFDAQPTELQGNIHNTQNPDEIVIGYLSICQAQEKRNFVRNQDLPDWNYSSGCFLYNEQPNDRGYALNNFYYPDHVTPFIIPVQYQQRNPSDPPPAGYIITYSAANIKCVDCTQRGTTNKPPFWP